MSTWKLPSPEANPATQLGSLGSSLLIESDSNIRGLIFGKAIFKSGDRHLPMFGS